MNVSYLELAGFPGHLEVAVGEGAEGAARAVAVGLHVVALGRLVDLRMELLLGARVAVLAHVAVLAARRIAPLLAVFGVRARRRPKKKQKLINLLCLLYSPLILS